MKATRTIYKPDGTLTEMALTDVILWTERRGLNLKELAEQMDTDPKDLGVAIQRAKASGVYWQKRKELIEKGLLKRDKPIEIPKQVKKMPEKPEPVSGPEPESQPKSELVLEPELASEPAPEPELEPKPELERQPEPEAATPIAKDMSGKSRLEYAKYLLGLGTPPEEAAEKAGYSSVKRMRAAISLVTRQTQAASEKVNKVNAEEPAPPAPEPLTHAFLGKDYVYVLNDRGITVSSISGEVKTLPWVEIEKLVEIRRKGVQP